LCRADLSLAAGSAGRGNGFSRLVIRALKEGGNEIEVRPLHFDRFSPFFNPVGHKVSPASRAFSVSYAILRTLSQSARATLMHSMRRTKPALDTLIASLNAREVQIKATSQTWLGLAKKQGDELIELKQACRHGEFQKLIEIRLAFSYSTATDYMKIARHWEKLGTPKVWSQFDKRCRSSRE
jgi:hypothetical protein